MNPIDKKLFDFYGLSILQEAESLDEAALKEFCDTLPLDKDSCHRLLDAFLEYYYQWSVDAFSLGLHLGLSLQTSHRPGPDAYNFSART